MAARRNKRTESASGRSPSRREWRWPRLPKGSWFALVPLLLLAAAALLLSPLGLDLASLEGGAPSTPRATIVDQLGATQPNPEFVTSTTKLLQENGYQVDYVPPENITVDFYRNLPQGDYDLLVLRVHSTAEISKGDDSVRSISLFTNEPYSRDRYYDEQVAGRIGFAQYTEDSPKYFGITAEFIKSSMKGRFPGTTVVMMGCEGLLNERAAKAFAQKGAGDFVSWDGLVSADHTDAATERLLRHLVVQDQPTAEAVTATMAEVGPDPTYGSRLLFQP